MKYSYLKILLNGGGTVGNGYKMNGNTIKEETFILTTKHDRKMKFYLQSGRKCIYNNSFDVPVLDRCLFDEFE